MWSCASTGRRRRGCGAYTPSSVSDPASAGAGMALKGASDGNPRKWKATAGDKGKGKDASMSTTSAKDLLNKEDSTSKRCKSMEDAEEQNSGKGEGRAEQQGFIHVRARRGEAMDNHNLAERLGKDQPENEAAAGPRPCVCIDAEVLSSASLMLCFVSLLQYAVEYACK